MRILLLILVFFVAATAIPCGLLLVNDRSGSVLQLSPVLLHHSVFQDFLIPGIILLFIVGGSNLLAFFALVKNCRYSLQSALLAGCLLGGWLFVLLLLIRVFSWFQLLYFSIAFMILFIVMLLLKQGRCMNRA